MKLYVGNLPFTTSSEDLNRLFASHGAVESAEVVTDRDGYLLRLVPDDADPYRTRALIDLGLAVREAAASTPPRC